MERQGEELGEVVATLARATARSIDPPTILGRVLDVLEPVVGPVGAAVWLWFDGELRPVTERPLPMAGGATLGDREELVVPLAGFDRDLGQLVVTTPPGRRLEPVERGLVEVAASQVAGALERARLFAEVMEVERLKSDFIARVSHELRTPITIINGFLETLLAHADDLPASQRDHMLRRAQTASSRLARLIEELLILSRIDAGVLSPTAAPVEIGSLLDQVRGSAQDPERVFVEAPPGRSITTDGELLARAVGLLVDNAIKYGGTAEVRALERDRAWHIEVRDRGAGFPEDVAATAFEMFTRSANATSVPGLGVGLPIARTLVEVLDGTIELDAPDDGSGAVVRVVLRGG